MPLLVGAAAVVLALPSLWGGLVFDDHFHYAALQGLPALGPRFKPTLDIFVFADGDPARMVDMMDKGIIPWWAAPELRLAFWRPLTTALHWVDYRLWPREPWLMHVHNLLWLAVMVVAAALVYRRFMGAGWVAGLAALLYAIDDARAMPAGWVANRNGLICAAFGFACIWLHDRWRRDGSRPAAVGAVGCLALALLAKETALGASAYLFAYALFIERGRWRARALSLAPYVIVSVAWLIVYRATGHGTYGSETYVSPFSLRFPGALIARAPALLVGQWALPPSDLFPLVPDWAKAVVWVWCVGALSVLGVLLAPLLRRDAVSRFWCVGMVLSAAPGCAAILTDRLLLFVGLGAMGLVAQFIAAVRAGEEGWVARAACWALIGVHLVLAPVLLPLRIVGFAAYGQQANRAAATAQFDGSIVDKTVVVVDAPHIGYCGYLMIMRALESKPVPAHIRSLGPNSGLPVPIRFTRTDERTLVAAPSIGFPWLLTRDRAHPFHVGDRVELSGMTIEVTKVARLGYATEVAYHFDVPLEDPSLVWLEVHRAAYRPFTPPAVGQSVVLNKPATVHARAE